MRGERPGVLRAADVGADARVVPHVREEVVVAERRVPGRVGVDPEAVAVAAVQREDLLGGQVGAAPRGGDPQRRGQPGLPGEALEGDEVAGLVVQLVLQLDGEHRAVARAASGEGGGELAEPFPDQFQVRRIVGPVPHGRVPDPVGEPAVAALAVAPRADPQDDVEPGRRALVEERADVEVAVEAWRVPMLDVVQPEHVRGHRRDAAGPHLPQPLRPAVPWHPAVVQLAGDRDDRYAVADEVPAGQRQPGADVFLVAHPGPAEVRRPRVVRDGEWRVFGRQRVPLLSMVL
ncbi:hypothetical protein Asp14428_66250 [Actinoplanes sp. NBRC 14428]|nr:hypothetical protein Asp14428_66250 [Actinoplanes sp. NBRC 14428]